MTSAILVGRIGEIRSVRVGGVGGGFRHGDRWMWEGLCVASIQNLLVADDFSVIEEESIHD